MTAQSTSLVQLTHPTEGRRIALVEEPSLLSLLSFTTIYDLAQHCIAHNVPLSHQARSLATGEILPYDDVYNQTSPWRLLPPIDVPDVPSRVLVAGTGLTHLGSARERQAMHLVGQPQQETPTILTDSMRMFQSGVESGRPPGGKIGIAPEWFYKGDASVLRALSEPLEIPLHAEDGGEEAEIAGIYLIAPDGAPHRIGLCQGNEFSDHKFEQRNYLNLAGSKLRACSVGPELIVGAAFDDIHGEVRIERNGKTIWIKKIASGEANMAHSLANLEHHHFKFDGHRQPGTVHVHFFGADALSFGSAITLRQDDIAHVSFEDFGRPLRNPIHQATGEYRPTTVRPLV